MKTTPQRDGTFRLVAADVVEAKQRLLDLPVSIRCDCGLFRFVGPVADGQGRIAEHRATEHPERADRGRRARMAARRAAPREFWFLGGEL